jgi:hypothetical protein
MHNWVSRVTISEKKTVPLQVDSIWTPRPFTSLVHGVYLVLPDLALTSRTFLDAWRPGTEITVTTAACSFMLYSTVQ